MCDHVGFIEDINDAGIVGTCRGCGGVIRNYKSYTSFNTDAEFPRYVEQVDKIPPRWVGPEGFLIVDVYYGKGRVPNYSRNYGNGHYPQEASPFQELVVRRLEQ